MTRTPATATTDPPQHGEPHDNEELIMFLEHDQLVSDRSRPVAPAHLGSLATLGLWALRIFVLVVSAMVIYTFIVQLK